MRGDLLRIGTSNCTFEPVFWGSGGRRAPGGLNGYLATHRRVPKAPSLDNRRIKLYD